MPTAFAANTAELDGPIRKISVVGELDLDTAPILETALLAARDSGRTSVLIDLSAGRTLTSSP